MALSSFDERDLLIPLFDGIHEAPLWETFLRRLLARTRAGRICLLVRSAQGAALPPLIRQISADPTAPPVDVEHLAALGVIPYATLRPNRVYALEEMLSLDEAAMRQRQAAALADADIAHARFIRIVSRGDAHAWLVLLHHRSDFRAADSALLSALAPSMGAALGMLAELDALRLRAALAEEALALLDVGQIALDREGRVIATDAPAARALEAVPGNRLPLSGPANRALTAACREVAGRQAPTRRIVRIDEGAGLDMVLRPLPADAASLPTPAVASGAIRLPRRANAASAARAIAQTFGLSAREAALADAISRGLSIIEAGAALKLSQETARNYTKRIYAKTGATGQADLVRMVLTGLAPLS